jgi:hypothetical protein
VEASLLPSARFRALSEKTVIVAVRKADPACDALRKEFDARATAWFVVLDRRGELLDSGAADESGALKTKEGAAAFPDRFAARVEQGIARTESLQDIERRFEQDPAEEAGFEKLASRLEELKANSRLRTLCEKVAPLSGLSADRRSGVLLRGFIARSREFGSLGTADADTRFVQDGERLIAGHAAHPKASPAVEALFVSGYARGFDLPGKCAAGIARLEAIAGTLREPAPLRDRIRELSALREREIEKLRGARAAAKPGGFTEAWYALTLGDAEATVDFFSKPPHDKNALYQRWVQEAREKIASK